MFMYDPVLVQPMRDELTRVGVKELRTAKEVDKAVLKEKGTTLVFVNSVCGCAAGTARPGLIKALKHSTLPEEIATVFAGVDHESVKRAREHIHGYPPSSPSVALFRDGVLVHMVERREIEGQSADTIATVLRSVFDKYCGPQIDESAQIYDPMKELEMSIFEVKEKMNADPDFILLDVRDQDEYSIATIPGASLVTEEMVKEILETWSRDTEMAVYCHHGERSLQAARFFKHHGFSRAKSMAGGINAWSQKIDTSIPQY